MTTATKTLLTTRELEEARSVLHRPTYIGSRASLDEQVKYAAERAAYDTAERELVEQWKNWLVAEFCPDASAKVAAEIYRRAWDEGHSSGYNEVANHYQEFADFASFVTSDAKNGN
jgi:hypothetical protein